MCVDCYSIKPTVNAQLCPDTDCMPMFSPDEADLARVFRLPDTTYIGGEDSSLPLGDIINRLKVTGFLNKGIIHW